ncbi:sensor histidine kinase [Parabacteroides pacaensis]|uniref:sensor histidine kinase n=1 Tax=Parabacteroides pacaensis TaxID=2086575 RepID=UPI000D0FF15D|nr:histidine kinase [Parabacteroides pacaensis]
MLNKLNHIVPDLLLKPRFRFYRHLSVQIIIALITINNLSQDSGIPVRDRLWTWLLAWAILDAIVYVNACLLVPRMLLAGNMKRYFIWISAILLLMASCNIFFYFYFGNLTALTVELIFTTIYFLSNICLIVAGITALCLFKNGVENKRRIEELQNATLEVELANLKNQINPHFLFNMLNNANILAGEDTDKSSRLLGKLNSLLKYQISDSSQKTVSLRDDIDFLNNYLELEKTRRGRFDYAVEIEGDCNIQIPPLLFIPFVENAVKHNPESDSFVNLSFYIAEDRLHFECENPKPRLSHPKKTGGIGLPNVKKRLDLLFGADYSLSLCDEKEKYIVRMEFKI